MNRIPVYFVPGLAANSLIFELIELPENEFECIYLEWDLPLTDETLDEYCKRFSARVKHPDPVLIGVSFGGMVVQEMAKYVGARRVIIISSAKSIREYPRKFLMARKTKLYKLMPVTLLVNLPKLRKFRFTRKINERLDLYKRYLGVKDKRYWNWAIEQVVMWERKTPDPEVIHIHGDEDVIFPAKYIHDFIPVHGGTHIMLVTRHKWFTENLPGIIRNGKME